MEVEEGWSQKREGTSQSNWTLEPVCRWGQGMGGAGGGGGGGRGATTKASLRKGNLDETGREETKLRATNG